MKLIMTSLILALVIAWANVWTEHQRATKWHSRAMECVRDY